MGKIFSRDTYKLKTLFILLLIQLPLIPTSPQDKLTRLTISIADTTQSKTEQAKAIYNWITHNIAYDTKQLKKGANSCTALQTINRRKAVCSGYANLFYEMCNQLGIECYMINGYNKGFGYITGDDFLRANHTWNIIYADSNWIFADATWGSGYLEYTYAVKTKIKQLLTKNTGIKTNFKFHKHPDETYFDTAFVSFSSTHFPLDAKWQFLNYPVSHKTFITDSIHKGPYLNYMYEISLVKNTEPEYQGFVEAINSIKYHPFNKFDIAWHYYFQVSSLKIGRKTSGQANNLAELLNAYDYLELSYGYLKDFKLINYTKYRSKKNYQRLAYKAGANTIKQLNRVPSSLGNRYKRNYNDLLNLHMKFSQWYNQMDHIIADIPDDTYFFSEEVQSYDTLLHALYLDKTEKNNQKLEKNFQLLLNFRNNMDSLLKARENCNDSALRHLNKVFSFIRDIDLYIDEMDPCEVYQACLYARDWFNNYTKSYRFETAIHNELVKNFNSFQDLFHLTNNIIKKQLELFTKLSKLTGDNFGYKPGTAIVYRVMKEINLLNKEVLGLLLKDEESMIYLMERQDIILTSMGNRGLINLINQLRYFHEFTFSENTKVYTENLNLYKNITADIKKRKAILKYIIRELNRNKHIDI